MTCTPHGATKMLGMTSSKRGPLVLVRFEDEFFEVVAALSTLKAAACKARDEVIPQEGRPAGSIYPWK